MKTNTLKTIGIVVSLIAGVGASVVTEAVPQPPLNFYLPQEANTSRTYLITCPTTNARLQIVDKAESPPKTKNTPGFVFADIGRNAVSNTSKDEDNDINSSTQYQFASVRNGPGVYTVHVYKEHVGPENYNINVMCTTTANGRIINAEPSAIVLQVAVDSVIESPEKGIDCGISANNCQ
jgi:hypothetical protein